jgi:cobalamin-dependent methionine synthase I
VSARAAFARSADAIGAPNMCLADFIDPEGEDWIGGFAVAIHGIEPHLARIGRDQLEDYAVRRGLPIEEAERWLRPNLD